MNRSETALALGMAAAFDRRTVGEADVAAWHAALGHLEFDDVKTAIAGHYADTTDWLMPAHVATRVKALRRNRLAAVPDPLPDADPGDTRAYIAALREGRHRIASGDERPRPVTAIADQVASSLDMDRP